MISFYMGSKIGGALWWNNLCYCILTPSMIYLKEYLTLCHSFLFFLSYWINILHNLLMLKLQLHFFGLETVGLWSFKQVNTKFVTRRNFFFRFDPLCQLRLACLYWSLSCGCWWPSWRLCWSLSCGKVSIYTD